MIQRVIKFRCWEPTTNTMHYNLGYISNGGSAIMGEHRPIIGGILLQYVGLTDKHGKEIYDKDILRFVGGTCNVMPCGNYGEHHTTGTLLIVKWLQSGWTLSPIRLIDADTPNIVGHVGNYDFWNHHRSFERLGDLYTTPELVDPKMIER